MFVIAQIIFENLISKDIELDLFLIDGYHINYMSLILW
jgi:hypothetical protein